MKKIVKSRTKYNQKCLLFHSLHVLVRSSNSEMLSWPNSPLLVLLQFLDPSVLSPEGEETRNTPLRNLANLLDPSDYKTHVNQLILAKQLIERGANVNAVSIPHGITPLHNACYKENVTNLDFVQLLLEEDADPNAQEPTGLTPFMYSTLGAPGAASFLLNWPTTDANITDRSGESFLGRVRKNVDYFSNNPNGVQNQFLLLQWREVERC